jgi:hypothetical protein
MDPAIIPADAPAWWGSLVALVLVLTQALKAALKSAPWWSAWVPRLAALLLGLGGAALAPLPGAWWLQGAQGLATGLASILLYDGMAASDSGIRRIGPVVLLCLSAWMALPMAGCAGNP